MEMTDSEIYGSWRRSDTPKAQIKILAELNDCKEYQIREIINKCIKKEAKKVEATIPKKWGPKPKIETAAVKPEEAAVIPEIVNPKEAAAEKKAYKLPGAVREAIVEKIMKNKEETEELKRFLEVFGGES